MDIYYCETTNPRKVCAVAKLLELDVNYHRVDLFQREQAEPAFADINPNRKVPVLIDGETRLFESTAIMAYLSHAAHANLWPSDPPTQIELLKWLTWDISHFSRHASTVYFEHYIRAKAGLGEPNQEAVEEAVAFFRQFAEVLDAHLASAPYVAGGQLSIADFSLACVPTVAREAELAALPIEEFAHITAWLDRLYELAAWREPWPPAAAS